MRSRYVGYVLGNEHYLLATWHASTRPAALELAADPTPTKWLGLDVLQHSQTEDTGVVEFVARFKQGGGPAQRLHETSRFVCEQGQWFYVDGDIHSR